MALLAFLCSFAMCLHYAHCFNCNNINITYYVDDDCEEIDKNSTIEVMGFYNWSYRGLN